MCALHRNAEEGRGTLIGKKVEHKTCRLPDVSVKAVSAAQVHSEVLEALHMHQREPSGSWSAPAGHLTSCFPAQLCRLHATSCSDSSILFFMLSVVRFCLLLNKHIVQHCFFVVKQKTAISHYIMTLPLSDLYRELV